MLEGGLGLGLEFWVWLEWNVRLSSTSFSFFLMMTCGVKLAAPQSTAAVK